MTLPSVPQIFDRQLANAKWLRAHNRQTHLGGANYISQAIAEDIEDRLNFMRFEPSHSLVVGDANGTLVHSLETMGSRCLKLDLAEIDEETPGPVETYDLFAHILGLGLVNDLPGALIHARNSLKAGGLFIAAFPGSGSMPVLRSIALVADAEKPAPRMHPLVDLRGATGLMERAGFARQVVDGFPLTVRYTSFGRMVNDLRDHGLTRSLATPAPQPNREWLARAEAEFDRLRGEDGKVSETFEILVLTGWR